MARENMALQVTSSVAPMTSALGAVPSPVAPSPPDSVHPVARGPSPVKRPWYRRKAFLVVFGVVVAVAVLVLLTSVPLVAHVSHGDFVLTSPGGNCGAAPVCSQGGTQVEFPGGVTVEVHWQTSPGVSVLFQVTPVDSLHNGGACMGQGLRGTCSINASVGYGGGYAPWDLDATVFNGTSVSTVSFWANYTAPLVVV